MTRRLLAALVLVLAVLAQVGCGGEKDRGKNKDGDRPRSADKGG
jgi:hypothetical protein